jgi:hypothetical protein
MMQEHKVTTLLLAKAMLGMLALSGGVHGQDLRAVGLISPANGFPISYQDGAGAEVELCLDLPDPVTGLNLCGLIDPRLKRSCSRPRRLKIGIND